jgi:hypothetical protein
MESKRGVIMIKTVLGYEIEDGVSAEEYERWLHDIHIPDILANPNVDRLSFNLVARNVSNASDGSPIPSDIKELYRVAEMEFADEAAYESYLAWFREHPVPPERGPKGRTHFRFYVVTESESYDRHSPLPPSFLTLE